MKCPIRIWKSIIKYYHVSHYMAAIGWENDDNKLEESLTYEREILAWFGLPNALRFNELLQFFSLENNLSAKRIHQLLRKLRKTATHYYLTEPVLSDEAMLRDAQEKEITAYDVLPMLGFETNYYLNFLIDILLIQKKTAPEKILQELNTLRTFTNDEIIAIYHARFSERKLKQISKGKLKYILKFYKHESEMEIFYEALEANPFLK